MTPQFENHARYSRRHFLRFVAVGLTTAVTVGCSRQEIQGARSTTAQDQATATEPVAPTVVREEPQPTRTIEPTLEPPAPTATPRSAAADAAEGILRSRPASPDQAGEATAGVQPLCLVAERDVLLYIPTAYAVDKPARLVVLLHGAGGVAKHGLSLLQELADEANLMLLAPSSRRQTWDVIHGQYGPDVALIDRALEFVFERYAVEPSRLAVGGFSDGASYALSLGMINGDLFSHILAFSPGFAAPPSQQGQPSIYVSHGTRDQVLPINSCSRRLVPILNDAGYDITYHEFDGPHTVPPEIALEALNWFLDGTAPTNTLH